LSDSPEGEVKEVISILEKETKEIKKKVSNLPQINIVVLAALNIVNEYCQFKKTVSQKKDLVTQKISELISYIDASNKESELNQQPSGNKVLSLF
jgi:cell division protein ZapA (FtsZ GTPase activity inhibitor)